MSYMWRCIRNRPPQIENGLVTETFICENLLDNGQLLLISKLINVPVKYGMPINHRTSTPRHYSSYFILHMIQVTTMTNFGPNTSSFLWVRCLVLYQGQNNVDELTKIWYMKWIWFEVCSMCSRLCCQKTIILIKSSWAQSKAKVRNDSKESQSHVFKTRHSQDDKCILQHQR